VKILDANLLLYAVNEDAPLHVKAKPWLEAALSGREAVGFDETVLLAFLRVSTRASIFPKPLFLPDAVELVESWLAQPCSVLLQPDARHWGLVRDLLRPLGTAANLIADAHLAALAIEHGAELCSCDADFSRFSGLRWIHPLS